MFSDGTGSRHAFRIGEKEFGPAVLFLPALGQKPIANGVDGVGHAPGAQMRGAFVLRLAFFHGQRAAREGGEMDVAALRQQRLRLAIEFCRAAA